MTASLTQTAGQETAPGVEASGDSQYWLVDFDHTLLAANSTELFIGHCAPSLLIAVIDFIIRRLVPWRFTRIAHWYRLRDYVCLAVIACLTPWNLWRLRRRAPALFAQRQSLDVAARLAAIDPRRIIIISFGNSFVIRALLRGSAYADCPVLATPVLPSPGWFVTGKAAIARAALGHAAVAAATVLTDSEDDRDLLEACADDQLIEPQGLAGLARDRLYLPLRYSGSVKFTRSFAIDQWLLVDSCIYGLSVAHGLAGLAHFALIAPLLSLSFMAIYEIGYFENDMEAALKEANPTLSGKETRYRDYPIRWQSWVWAAGIAAAALALAVWLGELPKSAVIGSLVTWIGLLIVSRLVFLGYNRVAPAHRILVYPALQISKYGSILMVFAPGIVGGLLVIAQIATMWVNYVVYRLGGDVGRYPKEPFRLVLFATMVLVVAPTGALHLRETGVWGADGMAWAAIAAWMVMRITKSALMRRVKAR